MYVEHVGQFKGLFVQYTQKDAILYYEVGHTPIQTLIQRKPQFKEFIQSVPLIKHLNRSNPEFEVSSII